MGDLNGDGIPDIVSVDARPYLVIRLGFGDGGFVSSALPCSCSNVAGIEQMRVVDVNGDGQADVICGTGKGIEPSTS
jgi:hypothetical protein